MRNRVLLGSGLPLLESLRLGGWKGERQSPLCQLGGVHRLFTGRRRLRHLAFHGNSLAWGPLA